MSGVEEVRLNLGHIELAAHLFGPQQGIPVIALHGWLDNANTFARLAPRLHGLRIVALDLAGHGYSDHRPVGAGYALWDYAHDVLRVAEQLGWQRFALLGHSLGAMVAAGESTGALPDILERKYSLPPEALEVIQLTIDESLDAVADGLALFSGDDE